MHWSVGRDAAIGLALVLAGCATKAPAPKPPAAWTPRGANFATAPGVPVFAHVRMPVDFVPSQRWSPLWVQHGAEIAVVGKQAGRTMVIGFSGSRFDAPRVIAADGGPGASIVDLAISPDGSTIATAMAHQDDPRVEVFAQELAGGRDGARVARYRGRFDSVSIAWLGPKRLAVALRRRAADKTSAAGEADAHLSELHLVNSEGRQTFSSARPGCDFSRLIWSPDASHAFADADGGLALLSLAPRSVKCRPLRTAPSIRFLGWAPDGNSFLYFSPLAVVNAGGGFGTFEYDLASDASRLIAISSDAAAYVSSGLIAVLGNRNLTGQRLATHSDARVTAELALVDTRKSETDISTLGLNTLAGMLSESAISYSPLTDTVAIEMPIPGPQVNSLLLFYFVIPKRLAGLLATGTAGGLAQMSWSPEANLLAVLDTESAEPTLLVLGPPH